MTVAEQLLPASFRGYNFLIENESADSGRKIVVHEYPNADVRNVEDLGLAPRVFKLSAVIHGDINKRFEFEQILRKKGSGELVHPVYGIVRVKTGSYTVKSSQEAVGEFLFSLTFYITTDIKAPEARELEPAKVTVLAKKVGDAAGDAFEGKYKVPSSAKSITKMSDRMNSIFSKVQQNINKVLNPVTDAVADFNKKRDAFRRDIVSIVQNANRIRETIDSVRLSMANFANLPEDLLDFWEDITDFGTTINPRTGDAEPTSPELPQDTDQRLEISNNLSITDEYIRVIALAGLVESVTYKASANNVTDTEIQELTTLIDHKTTNTLNQQVDDRIADFIAQDTETRSSIYELITVYKQVVSSASINTWKTRTETTGLTSLALLAHRHYGNLDNIEILEQLNNLINASASEGDVTLVS